jgi:hypothetical protein
MNKDKLHRIASEAVARNQAAERERGIRLKEKEEAQKRADAAKAESILVEAEARVAKAAEIGTFSKEVMRLGFNDYDRPAGRRVEPKDLRGAARIVFQRLKEEGMEPLLIDGHDGIGMHSWVDIVVRW